MLFMPGKNSYGTRALFEFLPGINSITNALTLDNLDNHQLFMYLK